MRPPRTRPPAISRWCAGAPRAINNQPKSFIYSRFQLTNVSWFSSLPSARFFLDLLMDIVQDLAKCLESLPADLLLYTLDNDSHLSLYYGNFVAEITVRARDH